MKVVFAGCTSSYGHSFAAVNIKTKLMAQGLMLQGATCSIYDGLLGFGSEEERFEEDGIEVVLPKRKGAVITGELRNVPHFYRYLKAKKQGGEKNVLVLELPLYHNYLSYVICAKLLGYKIATIAHEWAPTLVHINLYAKLSSWLYTKTFGKIVDGLLPISEYIIKRISHFKKPYLKVPALAEFPYSPIDYNNRRGGYFVYCASANYSRVAFLVIDAFAEYIKKGGAGKLCLILSGSGKAIDAICQRLKDLGVFGQADVHSKLPYEQLMDLYNNASALIIPLDPEYEQDIARFPQKIAEYCSTASPIITTNVGEAKVYFDDSNSLKAEFTPSSLAAKMFWIDNHKQEAKDLGLNAYNMGKKNLNYKVCGVSLFNFFNSL